MAKNQIIESKIREHFNRVPYTKFREDSQADGCWLYSQWFPIKKTATIEIMKNMPELEIRGHEVRKQRFMPNAIAETPPPWKK